MTVALARYFLIAVAVILAPLYGLWVGIGWMMDRRGQRAKR